MQWEKIDEVTIPIGSGIFGTNAHVVTSRAQVPGGWLILTITQNPQSTPTALTFYPDPAHTWDGT